MFPILIGESRLKATTMQIQLDDIAGGERPLWQVGKEEFVNDARTRDTNGTLLEALGMGRHHHTAQYTERSHRDLWTVVETADHLTFWTLLGLIGGQVQARLDERMIEHCVLFAAGHKGEASQVRQHGPSAVLAIEPEQGAFLQELVCSEVATDGREAL